MKKFCMKAAGAICAALIFVTLTGSVVLADELELVTDHTIDLEEAIDSETIETETIENEAIESEDRLFDKGEVAETLEEEPEHKETVWHQEIIDGKKYMVDDENNHYEGWYDMTSSWRLYFDPEDDGAAVTGVHAVEDKLYLFDDNGLLYRKSGTPLVKGKKYWVNEDATLSVGWKYLGNWKMYFDSETASAAIGMTDIAEHRYLFNQDGIMQNIPGTPIIDGKKYWFSTEGYLRTGWLHLGNLALYFDEETYAALIGISQLDGKPYLFNKDGVVQMYAGTTVVDGKKYWFGEDGALRTGWLTLGEWKLYFDPDTYEAAVGVKEIDGQTYFFNNDGIEAGEMERNVYLFVQNVYDQVGRDLYACYRWCVDNITYQSLGDSVPAGYTSTQFYSLPGFQYKSGDCRTYAACFYELAKYLGYNVRYTYGYVPRRGGGLGDHAWVELIENGQVYVCDPNFEYSNREKNGFKFTYGTSGTWMYQNYHYEA